MKNKNNKNKNKNKKMNKKKEKEGRDVECFDREHKQVGSGTQAHEDGRKGGRHGLTRG